MKTLALLSGKGGSGKTTLGLTMSSLLSKAQLKVLLIDCDMATHGATYFFEDQLPQNSHVVSFNEIVQLAEDYKDKSISVSLEELLYTNRRRDNSNDEKEKVVSIYSSFINVDDNFSFIPSIKSVGEEPKLRNSEVEDSLHKVFKELFMLLKMHFDVVILDCQAGYSYIFPSLLPLIDSVLMVLEPDKVSTIALRSLYKKISDYVPNKNIYQVFNKVEKDERSFYEKITFETFFINVGALLYDRSIRKAFAFCRIPDIEDNGMEFGQQLCDLCNNIFVDSTIRNKIDRYSKSLLLKKKKEEYNRLGKDLSKQKEKLKENNTPAGRIIRVISNVFQIQNIVFYIPFLISYALLIYEQVNNKHNLQYSYLLMIMCTFSFVGIIYRSYASESNSNYYDKQKLEETLQNMDVLREEIYKLNRVIDEDKNSSSRKKTNNKDSAS